MRQLAYYLDTEMDCTVKVGLPEGETPEDMADWLEQDDAATVLAASTICYTTTNPTRTTAPSRPQIPSLPLRATLSPTPTIGC